MLTSMRFLRLFAFLVFLECFADHTVCCAKNNNDKEISNNTGTDIVLFDNKSDQKEDGPADIKIEMHVNSQKSEDVKRLMKEFQNPNQVEFSVKLDDYATYALFRRNNRFRFTSLDQNSVSIEIWMYAIKLQEMGNITTNVMAVRMRVKLKNDYIITNDLVQGLNANCVGSNCSTLYLNSWLSEPTTKDSADGSLTLEFCREDDANNFGRMVNSELKTNPVVNTTERLRVGIGVVEFRVFLFLDTIVKKILGSDEHTLMGVASIGQPVCVMDLLTKFMRGQVTDSEDFTVDISSLKNPGIIRITINFDIEKDKYSSIWTVSHVPNEVPENASAKSDTKEQKNDYSGE
eukprot:988076_1